MKKVGVLYALGLSLFLLVMSAGHLFAVEDAWQKMGLSGNRKFILYLNTDSIKKVAQEIFVTVKRELSAEEQEVYKKQQYIEKERAEKEAGTKIEDFEELLKAMINSQTHMMIYGFNCDKNAYTTQSPGGSLTIIRNFEINKGSAEEAIKAVLCKKEE